MTDTRRRQVGLGVVEGEAEDLPSSDLGLSVRETHGVLLRLHSLILKELVVVSQDVVRTGARCRSCGEWLAIKATQSLLYRTALVLNNLQKSNSL